jgi:acyl dehydratase
MRIIEKPADLHSLVGQEVAVSDWMRIEQARINAFAAATDDQQWIHVDVERATRESPYRAPIAHGYLTLSLLPRLFRSAIRLDGMRMSVNYGLNQVRFPAPVRAGANIRARFVLAALTDVKGGLQLEWQIGVDCEGSAKPVCTANTLMRCYL